MRAYIQDPTAMLADTPPDGEATTATAGADAKASRRGHRHPRLTSAQWGVTDANGEASFTFTRAFTAKPAISFTYEESANNQPLEFKVKTWTQDGNGNYTGCVTKGYRMRTLPSSILVLTVLVDFSVTVNAPSGIPVSCIALQVS